MSHRRKLSVLLSALILISILNLSSIPAATVSHTASQITGGGTFGSGDYVFPNDMNVTANMYVGNNLVNSWLYNQTAPAIIYADTKAGTGNCPAGQVVQNITTGGVQCAVSAAGTYNTTYDAKNTSQWIRTGGDIYYQNLTGNVGIGAANPSYKLDVLGDVRVGSTNQLALSSRDSVINEIPIGFGIQSTSSGNGNLNLYPYGAAPFKTGIYYRSDATTYWYSGLEIANVNSGYGNLLLMKSGGNVGIGTSTPQQRLNVVGDANVTGTIYAHNYSANSPITFVNSTGGAIMIINEGGNMNLTGNLTVSGALNGINISTIGSALPIGSVVQYVGATAPDGFFLCNGSSYSRTAYADLFAAIGTTYGNTSDSTFRVPDFRGIFPKGAGTQGTASWASSNYTGTLGTYTQDKAQGHKHSVSPDGQNVPGAWVLGGTDRKYVNTAALDTDVPKTDGTNGVPRTGTTTEPASLGINYIIKAFNPTSINTSSNSVIGGNLTVNQNLYVTGTASTSEINTGWVGAAGAFEFIDVSANEPDPTYAMRTTAVGNLEAYYHVGMKIMLTNTAVKYFIVTKVNYDLSGSQKTTVHLYGGTDYDLVNAAITGIYYSLMKCPSGFPMDPAKWTLSQFKDTSIRQQNPTVAFTWYNLGTALLDIPIGAWDVEYDVATQDNTAGYAEHWVTLSTGSSSETDTDMTTGGVANGDANGAGLYFSKRKILVLTTKTRYYLNEKTGQALNFYIRGDMSPTMIKAISAYL